MTYLIKEDIAMKRKLMATKYSFISTMLAAVFLCSLLLPLDRANAGPPEPTPNSAVDIRTRVRPYQTLDADPFRPDSRVFEEIPLQSQVEEYPASALDQRTFHAIADATVLQGYSTLNFGKTVDMWAGYDEYLDPDGRIARSLIRFNIASLSPDATITEATLRVYLVGSWDYPNTSRTITTYRITSNWSESSVTWNNRPGYGAAYGSTSIVSGEWDWYEFDVTDLISAWCDGTYTNHGIMLRGPEISGLDSSWRSFGAREGSYTPQLVVKYATTLSLPVDSITPDSGTNDGVVHITNLAGADFQTGATVKLTKVGKPDIHATNVVVVNAAQITCDFDLTDAATGAWNVEVTNPDGESGALPYGFTITSQQEYTIYLPLTLKRWPPIPYTPVLNSISNPDGDGNYTVSWSSAELAQDYTLEEATNARFSDASVVYHDTGTSYTASDQPVGTYYYRVKASNSWGDSGWSNIETVTVSPPPTPEPCPTFQTGRWSGDANFTVSRDRSRVEDFEIEIDIPLCGEWTLTASELPINNCGIEFSYRNGVMIRGDGTFTSKTEISGQVWVYTGGSFCFGPWASSWVSGMGER
jgi:hypothetical protein